MEEDKNVQLSEDLSTPVQYEIGSIAKYPVGQRVIISGGKVCEVSLTKSGKKQLRMVKVEKQKDKEPKAPKKKKMTNNEKIKEFINLFTRDEVDWIDIVNQLVQNEERNKEIIENIETLKAWAKSP